MKVLVKKVDIVKGTNAKGEPYLFSNVLVVFNDTNADYVTVDSSVCHPDKIKAGMRAEMYCPNGNLKRASIFEPLGAKNEAQPNGGYTEVNAADYDLDPATGELVGKDKNKK